MFSVLQGQAHKHSLTKNEDTVTFHRVNVQPSPMFLPIFLSFRHETWMKLNATVFQSLKKNALDMQTFVVVQSLSRVQCFATPQATACQAPLSFIISWSLLKLMSIESMLSSQHLILCCPLLFPSTFPASQSFPMSWLFASGSQLLEKPQLWLYRPLSPKWCHCFLIHCLSLS